MSDIAIPWKNSYYFLDIFKKIQDMSFSELVILLDRKLHFIKNNKLTINGVIDRHTEIIIIIRYIMLFKHVIEMDDLTPKIINLYIYILDTTNYYVKNNTIPYLSEKINELKLTEERTWTMTVRQI